MFNTFAGPGEDDFVQWDIQFSPPGTNTPALSRGIRAISLSFICFGSDVTQTGDLALGMVKNLHFSTQIHYQYI